MFLKNFAAKFDLRNQIYAIIYKTGFKRELLTLEQQQKLEIIKNYKDIRVGELWSEIQENLSRKKTTIVSEDEYFIKNNIEEMKKLLSHCIHNQQFLDE